MEHWKSNNSTYTGLQQKHHGIRNALKQSSMAGEVSITEATQKVAPGSLGKTTPASTAYDI
jgi:hypothetical protein